jgi:hypothetical protein
MKKYYLTDGEETFGPFSIEELKDKSIVRDSYVWHQDLEDWKQAMEVEELAELFVSKPIVPPPLQPPPLQPPSIAAPPPLAAQPTNYQRPPAYHKPPAVWPKILLAIGLPVALFVALLLTGVIKVPGLLDGSFGTGGATGNPEKDALTMVKKQEDFARLANEVARDRMIDEGEMRKLESVYKEILMFFGSYAGNKEAREKMDQLVDHSLKERARQAESEFNQAMMNLTTCDGFEELNLRMQNLVEELNINFSEY